MQIQSNKWHEQFSFNFKCHKSISTSRQTHCIGAFNVRFVCVFSFSFFCSSKLCGWYIVVSVSMRVNHDLMKYVCSLWCWNSLCKRSLWKPTSAQNAITIKEKKKQKHDSFYRTMCILRCMVASNKTKWNEMKSVLNAIQFFNWYHTQLCAYVRCDRTTTWTWFCCEMRRRQKSRAFSSLLLSFIYSRNQQQVDASARRRRELWNNECINII